MRDRNHEYTVWAVAILLLAGCLAVRPSNGGGQTGFTPPRRIQTGDVAVPEGYRIELVARDLTFPTGIAFDDRGRAYVLEAGYAGEVWTTPRLLRLEADGTRTSLAEGGRNGPWNGVAFHDGAFYIAEGGELEGGRILRVSQSGDVTPLIRDLPSRGDHHTNGPAVGADGRIYFSIGTYTNSGIVGEENARLGWLVRFPELHDVPCRDVTLAGINYRTKDVLRESGDAETGAFVPFGTPTAPGQVIEGRVPCSGAVFALDQGSGDAELVAWGFRNPFGMAFAPDGALYVTDNAYDNRGSRPVHGAGELLWRVEPGRWYGWPDFHGARSLDDGDHFVGPGTGKPRRLLQEAPGVPPRPAAQLGVHASATSFDFSRSAAFGHAGEAFVALFGDQAPMTGKTYGPVGFKVIRVDPASGSVNDFAINRGRTNGPASRLGSGGLERPIAVRFDASGEALYVVDFGVMTMSERGGEPHPGTGAVWKITREAGSVAGAGDTEP
jgi:glucose/arabinose dehydrogenase